MSLNSVSIMHAQVTAGHNLTGAISVTGLQVGDLLLNFVLLRIP